MARRRGGDGTALARSIARRETGRNTATATATALALALALAIARPRRGRGTGNGTGTPTAWLQRGPF
eukprot:11227566-Lingulodinium_polyedra.AAC.1